MKQTTPVIPGLQHLEKVIAAHQIDLYEPLPALVTPSGQIVCRFQLTAEEIAAVIAGGDVYISILTFNRPLQPFLLTVGNPSDDPRQSPTQELLGRLGIDVIVTD